MDLILQVFFNLDGSIIPFHMKKQTYSLYTTLLYCMQENCSDDGQRDCPVSCQSYFQSIPDVLCRGFLDSFYSPTANVLSNKAFPLPWDKTLGFPRKRFVKT